MSSREVPFKSMYQCFKEIAAPPASDNREYETENVSKCHNAFNEQ
jgi:hypothetical protein